MLFLFPWSPPPPRPPPSVSQGAMGSWGAQGPWESQGVMPFSRSARLWGPPVAARGRAGVGERGSPARGPGQGLVPGAQLNPGPDTRRRLGLPPGQLTIYCGTARWAVPPAAAELRALFLHLVLCAVRLPGRHGWARGQWNSSKSSRTNPALAWDS